MVKASLAQLRQADREERHAWRLVDAELRTKLVDFDEFSGHRFEDITGGERPPAAEEVETWTNNPLSQNSPLRIRVADVEVLARTLVSAVIKLSRSLKENESVQENFRLTPSRHTLLKEISTEEFGDVCQTAQFHVCLRREVEARIETGIPLP